MGTDEDFRECDDAADEWLRRNLEKQIRCPRVQGVRWVEMGDEDARVQNDHDGQSSRSRCR
jgi:hypothetical protein